MTTINEAKEAILDRFIEQWTSTEYALDNESFDSDRDDLTEWVRIAVRNQQGRQETLGPKTTRRYERRGIIFIQVFVQRQTGTQNADVLSRQARDIFEGEKFDGVIVNNCSIREIGNDGRWFQTNVDCNFLYHEFK